MNAVATRGIVLMRTNFAEADRILTVLTPDYGKLSLIAKGVRKSQSKLAAGVELLNVAHISFIPPKKEVGTLISSRLNEHFPNITKNLERTQAAYQALKHINKLTESVAGEEYFLLARSVLWALNNQELSIDLYNVWFGLRLLEVTGHSPNFVADTKKLKLQPDQNYTFDFDAMAFTPHKAGMFGSEHIKLLRVVSNITNPAKLALVQGTGKVLPACQSLVQATIKQSLPAVAK